MHTKEYYPALKGKETPSCSILWLKLEAIICEINVTEGEIQDDSIYMLSKEVRLRGADGRMVVARLWGSCCAMGIEFCTKMNNF